MGKGARIRAGNHDKMVEKYARAIQLNEYLKEKEVRKREDSIRWIEYFYCNGNQYDYDSDDAHMYGCGIDIDRAWADHRAREAVSNGDTVKALSEGWL